MSTGGLDAQLDLDVAAALNAVDRLEAAFIQAGQSLQQQFEQAVAALQVPDANVELTATADTTEVTAALDDAVASADTVLPVTADGQQLTLDIDSAVAAADSTVEVSADTTDAQTAISALSGESIELDVNAPGVEELAPSLDAIGAAGEHAASGTHAAGGEFAALGIGAKLAAGEVSAGTEAFDLFGSAGLRAAAGATALVVVGKELFSNALDSRTAQERYNLVLGNFAEQVDTINVGGLNEDLDTLSTRLGSTGVETEQAAAKIFQLGTAAGVAGPKVADTTEQVIALAARAVALNPQLGNLGDSAERLFSGLARGGRFAANFGIALTAADINARALADTGKTVAADLTVYEKAAAGAELATQKLGNSLATDVNAGAQNVQIRLNAVKARFEEALEALGQPLLDPVIDAIGKAEPTLEHLAGLFAEILPPVVDVAGAFADALVPALEVVSPLAVAVGGALEGVAAVLNVIPGPVKTAAAALVVLQLATAKLGTTVAAANLEAGLTGLAKNFGTLAKSISPVTIALAASVGVFALVQHQADNTDAAVSAYLDDWLTLLNTAPDAKSYADAVDQVAAAANDVGDKANGLQDIGSKLFKSGDRRQAIEAATGLRSIFAASQQVTAEQQRLQTQYHLSADAANALVRSGAEQVAAFEEQAAAGDELSGVLAEAQRAQEDFWLGAATGALTAADIAEAAQTAGISFEDMAKQVGDARQPVLDFATAIIEALPGAEKALNDLGENQGLDTFVKNFEKNVNDAASFISNLRKLVDEGATDLARILAELSKTDPGKAAALAAQAASEPIGKVLEQNAKIGGIQFKETLVDFATQNLADDLSGGIDLAANKIREDFGKRLELIPGQLGGSTTVVGTNIAQELADSISTSPALAQLPADMKIVGEDAQAGFKAGLTGDDLVGIQIAAENMANSVINAAKRTLGIHSPSSVLQDIGELTVEGFAAGLADFKGAADLVDPLLKTLNEFKLTAADVAKASGSSLDEITKSLEAMGKAQQEITPDELVQVGKAVDALGGSKGVKELQSALAQQVSAAFGGLGGKDIADIVGKFNTQAALSKVQSIVGITPTTPDPFATNVVKGADAGAPNVDLTVNVTPPPDTTAEEQAFLIARATGWQLQSVALS